MIRAGKLASASGAAAESALLLYIISLVFMRPTIRLFGFSAQLSDLIYLVVLAALAFSIASGARRLAWDRAYVYIGSYFAAMALSAFATDDLGRFMAKLATQLYLLSLPVVILTTFQGRTERLRSAFAWWMTGTAIVCAIAVLSLLSFVVDPDNLLYRNTKFYHGTLPSGEYPRLSVTFINGNMLCNYLVCSGALALVATRLGWIRPLAGWVLLLGIATTALATISPGLGGVALLAGFWLWLIARGTRPLLARAGLAAGAGAALLFVAASTVTLIHHPTASFLIHVPGLAQPLAPSPRLMLWLEAAANFAASPLLGLGVGSDAAEVIYLDPSGYLQRLTDAHNSFLNVAAQCGLVGLLAFSALLAGAWRRSGGLRQPVSNNRVPAVMLAFAFLNGMAYQGLTGSFEDARHLWVIFGFLLLSTRAGCNPNVSGTAEELVKERLAQAGSERGVRRLGCSAWAAR